MSIFADQMLLRFLQDDFVENLLQNQIGLPVLFDLTYEPKDIELQEISLANVRRRQFQMPAFETIRASGMEERILPTPERTQVNQTYARYGRLAWVEVFLEVLLSTRVHQQRSQIENITTKNLLEELGEVSSLAELRTRLEERYPESIVEAFFAKLDINNVEDFQQKGNLLVEFFYQEPAPFDPDDPQNSQDFRLNICVKLQSEFAITEALQSAKLCRNILENEQNFVTSFAGGEVKQPYVFLTIFQDSLVVDDVIPGLTGEQIKDNVRNLFALEGMLAYFFAET